VLGYGTPVLFNQVSFFSPKITLLLRTLRLLLFPMDFVTNLAKYLVLAEAGMKPS